MTEDETDIGGQVYEIIRLLISTEPTIIAPIEVNTAEITGKRGIFGEPSYKELTIKVRFVEDSQFKEEKLKQYNLLNDELGAERLRVCREIARLNAELGRDTSV